MAQDKSDVYEKAHEFASLHREDIVKSDHCGCFNCLKIFTPDKIQKWIDPDRKQNDGETALCPACKVDCVVGSFSGIPVTPEFLRGMHEYWFVG